MDGIELIKGAVSFETAAIVDDYPYGFRLRCKKAYWVETSESHGQRLVTRTTNPKKRGEVWNKPHAETYRMAVVLYRETSTGYIKDVSLGTFADAGDIEKFLADYGSVLDEGTKAHLNKRLAATMMYESRRKVMTHTTYADGQQAMGETMIEPTRVLTDADRAFIVAQLGPAKPQQPPPDQVVEGFGPLFG